MSEADRMAARGERRRRRESERAAALAAEQAGGDAPLTRRELRRRQLEEQARLEAIATGELQLGPAGTYEVRKAAREASASAAPATSDPAAAGSATTAATSSVRSAGSAAATSSDSSATAASPGSAHSAASGAVPVGQASSTRSTSPAGGATASTSSPASAPSAASSPASAPSAATGAIAAGRPPSRRSIRDKRETADDSDIAPRERTATGLRPVVRTPSSVHGVRRLDATGQLTGVQPAVRPDDLPEHPLTGGNPVIGAAAARPAGTRPTPAMPVGRRTSSSTGTSDPVEWDDAVTGVGEIIAVSPQSAQIDLTSARSPGTARPSEVAASGVPTANTPDDDEHLDDEHLDDEHLDDEHPDDDEYDDAPLPRPQWVAISSVSSASADEAGHGVVTRRSLRAASTSSASEAAEEHEDERATPHPMVAVIKIVVLAFVAAIIGALIWLLATEAFDDTPNAAALTISTISTIDHPEETSAS